jgi:phosphoribosylformylglycinamidine synthase
LQQFVLFIIREKLIQSAHDISEGGLMICLFEKAFHRNLGFEVSSYSPLGDGSERVGEAAFWFGEAQSRVVITIKEDRIKELEDKSKLANITITKLGVVTKGEIKVNGESWGNIKTWKKNYDEAIEKILNQEHA